MEPTALPVLELDRLSISYDTEDGRLDTVRQLSLRVQPREKYGLVGESGSGKSTLALGVMGYLAGNGRVTGGRILLNGVDLLSLPDAERRKSWGGQIGMVYQNPATALNPALVIGDQIAEVARVHLGISRREAWDKAVEMLRQVRMPDPDAVARRYPHQLSGGMIQRALIAMALISNPQLLIMDEPTTALDVTTEAVVLDLIQTLSQDFSSAILYITHNLGVVSRLCDRVGVMYAGELLEEAPVRDLFHRPLHPYTRGLIDCVPRLDDAGMARLNSIPGFIPPPDKLPSGCVFAPRCPLAQDKCRAARPPLVEVIPSRHSACLRWEVLAGEKDGVETGPVPRHGAAGNKPLPSASTILEARGIKRYFDTGGLGLPGMAKRPPVRAVDGISIQVQAGTTLGIVGESGCGKTTFGRVLMGLVEPTEGEASLGGAPLPTSVGKRPRSVLKRLQMVFQNPDASLNPQMTVGQILARPLSRLAGVPERELRPRVLELLKSVQLPESYIRRRPEELSGGEKQRVAIARAFAADPEVVICDEPVSAMDVSVQGSLLNLLGDLQESQGTSYLFISHDLAAVRHIADQIAVVYLGRLWEVGTTEEVFGLPYHPYTEALLSAIPVPDPDVKQKRIRLEGSVPSAINIPSGCRFHTRCPRKIGKICETQEPPWQRTSATHSYCCHIPPEELIRIQTAVVEKNGGDTHPHTDPLPQESGMSERRAANG